LIHIGRAKLLLIRIPNLARLYLIHIGRAKLLLSRIPMAAQQELRPPDSEVSVSTARSITRNASEGTRW